MGLESQIEKAAEESQTENWDAARHIVKSNCVTNPVCDGSLVHASGALSVTVTGHGCVAEVELVTGAAWEVHVLACNRQQESR